VAGRGLESLRDEAGDTADSLSDAGVAGLLRPQLPAHLLKSMQMRLIPFLLLLRLVCAADPTDDLRLRWRRMLVGGALDTSLPQVETRLTSMESMARRNWSSLDKSPARQSLWPELARTNISADITGAYSRLRSMAAAWATPGQDLYHDGGLLADTIGALDWMDAHRYHSGLSEYDNWWDFEIGTPVILVDIATLLYDQLTADQLSRYMAAIEQFDADPRVMIVNSVSTGANLADKCKAALLRGALLKDSAKVALASHALMPLFALVTTGDGFYADGSFIQHRRHAYTGSYGQVLLSDMANLLYLLAGSQWDIAAAARDSVRHWVWDGFTPLIYKGAMMDMVRGRGISRVNSSDHGSGHGTVAALLRLTESGPTEDAARLRGVIKRWLQDDTSRDPYASVPLDLIGEARRILNDPSIAAAAPPTASHIFASMDRVIHQRPGWAAGIAMHSARIYNFENIDNENFHAWHTGDGMVYLYNADLLQFSENFWPTVDPQRMPGTTVIAGSTPQPGQVSGSAAVGGTSLDGYSVAMMQLQPAGGQLSAKKSWFLFDDEIVALGADIRSTAPGKTVETIIENRRLTGGGAVFTAGPDRAWVHLASGIPGADIGYYLPGKATWRSLEETRHGSWRDINANGPAAELTARYGTLWFDHGVMPEGETYAYVVLLGKSPQETARYAAAPAVEIIQNDAAAQAIAYAGLGIRAVNFWAAAHEINGITADAIASVLVHDADGVVNLAVADPTQANEEVLHVEVITPAGAVVSADDGVAVDQTAPTVRLSIGVRGSQGKTFRVSLRAR